MKKIHLIEAVIDHLTGGDATADTQGQYHPLMITKHIELAFNQVVFQVWLNSKKFSDYSQLDAWSKTYQISVLNQVGAKAHAFLPYPPMQLPNNMGIRQINDHDNTSVVFAYLEATANAIFSELEVSQVDTTPTFRIEQNNLSTGAGEESHMLRLEKLPLDPDAITSLDIMMIVPLEKMSDYDDIAIPAEMGEDGIVKQIVEVIRSKPAQDTVNDQNANIPVVK
jgi:hypothetical protein